MKKRLIAIGIVSLLLFVTFSDPVEATTGTFNPSHDGQIACNPACGHATWSDYRNGASGNSVNTTSTTYIVTANDSGFSEYYGARTIFCFADTATIPDASSISAVTFSVVADSGFPVGSDRDFIVVPANPADPTALTTSDFNNITFTAWSNRLDDSSFTNGSRTTFTFNATGIAGIDKTGTTCLALIEANYDFDNTTPPDAVTTSFRSRNYADVTSDPILEVVYSGGAATAVPPAQFLILE